MATRTSAIIPSEWKYKVKKEAAKQLAVIGSLLREADSVVTRAIPTAKASYSSMRCWNISAIAAL